MMKPEVFRVKRFLTRTAAACGLAAATLGGAASAASPSEGAIGFQPPATEIMRDVEWIHNIVLMPIITAISLLVLGLLIWVSVRYNRRANPVPRQFSHNTTVEVLWTVVPVLILVVIAAFTFPLLYKVDRAPMTTAQNGQMVPIPEEDWLNVKVQGNQWNWTYSYTDDVDESGFPLVEFISNPLQRGLSTDVAGPEKLRNLQTDYPLVVPAGRYIRYNTAAADVIHSWTVPAFGVKTDAIPGRLNEGWFKVDEPGVYYGQCSELCGKDHAYMPIEVRVVPERQFEAWYEAMKAGDFDGANALVATIEPLQGDTRLADAAR